VRPDGEVVGAWTSADNVMADKRTFTFLGTGTSVGVPMLGCDCAVCTSTNPRNHRYRCAVLLRLAQGRILIDTPPELRLQLLREQVGFVHAVLYTHYHADHLFGLDDLRPMGRQLGGPVPLYCTAEVEGKIRTAFSYAFGPAAEQLTAGMIPKLTFRRINDEPFEVLGERVTPIPMHHGHFHVYGFRVGDVAYCTDVSSIPRSSWPLLEGLDVLVIDALRPNPHPAHFGLDQALDAIAQFRPQQAYLTHMSHEMDHEKVSAYLPANVALAHDGLSFEF
jgi:phosphoribosyl 1,2-cyclic phosphate phosphodiesterase